MTSYSALCVWTASLHAFTSLPQTGAYQPTQVLLTMCNASQHESAMCIQHCSSRLCLFPGHTIFSLMLCGFCMRPAPALCASVFRLDAGQALKETLDDVRKRRLTYDNARGPTASPSREVCAVKEVRFKTLTPHSSPSWLSSADIPRSSFPALDLETPMHHGLDGTSLVNLGYVTGVVILGTPMSLLHHSVWDPT